MQAFLYLSEQRYIPSQSKMTILHANAERQSPECHEYLIDNAVRDALMASDTFGSLFRRIVVEDYIYGL